MTEPALKTNGRLGPRARVALLAFLAIAGFFLVTEHWAHMLGVLPYLLLLACPLVHFFHGGHGHRGHGGSGEQPSPRHDETRR
jgi:DUF2933 family protein